MEDNMQGDNPISWLMFFTLAATVFVIAGAFLYFLRSQRNRDIAADALGGDNSRVGTTPNGAGPELIGFAVIAVAVMALLATGYASKSRVQTVQLTTPVAEGTTVGQASGQRSGATTGTSPQGNAQPAGTADAPKVYQPANPAPDTRSAPTSSDTGVGNANGSTGQPK
jgi:hypothetical protein